jgi:hypothetical protein
MRKRAAKKETTLPDQGLMTIGNAFYEQQCGTVKNRQLLKVFYDAIDIIESKKAR